MAACSNVWLAHTCTCGALWSQGRARYDPTICRTAPSPLINPRKWESDDDMPIQHGVPKALDIGFNSLVPNSEVRKIYKVVLEGLYVVAWRGCDISRQNRQASHPWQHFSGKFQKRASLLVQHVTVRILCKSAFFLKTCIRATYSSVFLAGSVREMAHNGEEGRGATHSLDH